MKSAPSKKLSAHALPVLFLNCCCTLIFPLGARQPMHSHHLPTCSWQRARHHISGSSTFADPRPRNPSAPGFQTPLHNPTQLLRHQGWKGRRRRRNIRSDLRQCVAVPGARREPGNVLYGERRKKPGGAVEKVGGPGTKLPTIALFACEPSRAVFKVPHLIIIPAGPN